MQKNAEVWLAIYIAAIRSNTSPNQAHHLAIADDGLREFNKRFPASGAYNRSDNFTALPPEPEEEEIKPSTET